LRGMFVAAAARAKLPAAAANRTPASLRGTQVEERIGFFGIWQRSRIRVPRLHARTSEGGPGPSSTQTRVLSPFVARPRAAERRGGFAVGRAKCSPLVPL